MSKELFNKYVKTFYKIKQEASGCPCKEKVCPLDCPEKLAYIAENKRIYNIDLDPEKIIKNEGLRFIAKICLNNLWGHFGMREDFRESKYISTHEEQIDIVFNDKYKDVSQIVLNEEFRLMEYRTKEEYKKPNKSTNIYIAVFTTTWARLKLHSLLEVLEERVMYMDTDSVMYIDDESEACQKVKELLGSNLGELTDELKGKHMTEWVSGQPKDYGYELNDGSIKVKNKGIICNAQSEEKITFEKKIEMVLFNDTKAEKLDYTRFILKKEDNKIRVKKQFKVYDFEFDKRMYERISGDSIDTKPYGF